MRIHQIATFVASLLLATSSASATTFYVNDDGSAEYTNCSTAPYALISTALAAAVSDGSTPHTINVCPGTYNETALMNLNNNRFIDMTITGLSSGPVDPSEVVVQGNAAATTVDVFRPRRSGITIKNLTINAGNFAIRTFSNGPDFSLIDVVINAPDNDCIRVDSDTITLTKVTLNNCAIRGLEHNFAGTATVDTLHVVNPGNDGIYLANLTAGTFINLEIDNSPQQAIQIVNSDSLTLQNIDINTTTNDAILLNGVTNSTFGSSDGGTTRNRLENIGNGNNDYGLEILGASNNNFEYFELIDIEDDGIYMIDSDNNDFFDIDITSPDVTTVDGVFIDADSNGNTFDILSVDDVTDDCFETQGTSTTVTNSTFNNCSDNGMQITGTNAVLDDVAISITGNHGIQIDSVATGAVLTDIVINTTSADGILISSPDADLDIGDGTFTIDNAGTNGIEIDINSIGTTGSISSITITNPTLDGVLITGTNAVLDNITINNAGSDGIQIGDTGTNADIANLTVNTTAGACFVSTADGLNLLTADLKNCSTLGSAYGFDLNVTGTGVATINGIDVDTPGWTGTLFRSLNAGTSISNISVNDPITGDGMIFWNVEDSSISNLTFVGADLAGTDNGIQVRNGNNSTYSGTNTISDTRNDGLLVTNNANGNTFTGFTITNSRNDGINIDGPNSNEFFDNQIVNNLQRGVRIQGGSNGSIVRNNLILESGVIGLLLEGTGAGSDQSAYENCFRNTTNIQDDETTHTNIFVNAGRGNFYGSIPPGTGFSETCTDAGFEDGSDDDICDSAFSIPGAAGSSDTSPLQICADYFTTTDLTFSKTVLTFSDPINGGLGNNPKAIPGATMLYTITVTNTASSNLTGAAEDATITDDFTSEIVTNGRLTRNIDTMEITSPDAGTSVSLSDTDFATDGDAGEFIGNLLSARCGDLNAGESCTLTFTVDVQ